MEHQRIRMKIDFIVNNKNNRLDKVIPGLQSYFQDRHLGEVRFLFTQHRKHAIALAEEAAESGCDHLIAVGGDGTLHEVINGVCKSNIDTDDYPVIGLLPYGSANDFARTTGVSNSPEELHERILSNSTQKIDLGKITLDQTGETCYFINIAGVGLGAEVAQHLEGTSSLWGPRFNYFKHIILGFLQYVKKEVTCTSSTWQFQGKLLQMAIANGKYFGNAICVAPDAQLNDGRFQISIFGELSIWDYLKNLGKLKKGIKIRLPEVCYYESEEVRLESDDPCGIEADGEYVGLLPATLRVIPIAIRFLMPPEQIVHHKRGEKESNT